MTLRGLSGCAAAVAFTLLAFGQRLNLAPVPEDPLELINGGGVQAADSAVSRDAALQLLARARSNFALQSAGQGYDLKIKFTVNSGGATEQDGAWKMEDIFVPGQGLRFTATSSAGYALMHIAQQGKMYSNAASNYIPLRLQEARAALFGPIPSAQDVKSNGIRTSLSSFNGRAVTCVLLGRASIGQNATLGRHWEETEACIDPQSGLLQTFSQAPGRYYAYDYANGPQFASHSVPKKVIVTEGGRTVSEIEIEGLAAPAANPNLFVPTAEMKERGRATSSAGAEKVTQVVANGVAPAGGMTRPVVVFGLITPSGDLVDAHSLQPSDPNSQAAVAAANRTKFSPMPTPPQQRFVFILTEFANAAAQ